MKRHFGTIWVLVLSILMLAPPADPASAAGPKPKDFVSYIGRILNSGTSTAPFIDYLVTGYLTKQLKGF